MMYIYHFNFKVKVVCDSCVSLLAIISVEDAAMQSRCFISAVILGYRIWKRPQRNEESDVCLIGKTALVVGVASPNSSVE